MLIVKKRNDSQVVYLDNMPDYVFDTYPYIAYKRKSIDKDTNNYTILRRISVSTYGFVPFLGTHDCRPSFIGNTPEDCIEKAVNNGREVLLFSSLKELLTYIGYE